MKQYNIIYNVGKIKYLVNYHDGEKKHKDGSNFYDAAIFSNKKKMQKFVSELILKGYIYGNNNNRIMKTILTATILFLPCFLILNESESILPNLIGVAYVVSLYLVGQTKQGKLSLKKLYKETCKLENKILK